MFREPRYDDSLEMLSLPSERILRGCPWLWAFNQSWIEGRGSQIGSVHSLLPEVAEQKFGTADEAVCKIYFLMIHRGVHTAMQVPKSILSGAPFDHRVEGKTVAERIISAADIAPNWMREDLANGTLTIPQIVIVCPGSNQEEHYYIYQNTDGINRENLLPILLSCAPEFVPSRFLKNVFSPAD